MRVLSGYVAKGFLGLLCLCEGIFVFIYLVVDFLQKVDNFIEAQVVKGVMFTYFLYKVPLLFVQMLPPSTLISVIILFSLMRRRNEVAAIKGCGINLVSIMYPVMIASFLLCAGSFLFSELIVSRTSLRSNEIWRVDVEKRDPGLFYGSNQVWYRRADSIYWIRHFDSEKKTLENPTFYFFDKDFRLSRKVEGRRGIWQEGGWKLEEGIIQEANRAGGYELTRFKTLHMDIPETPETFMKGMKKPEEMSYWQLKGYAEKVRQEGYDNTRYLVETNLKIAFPLLSFALVFLGIPIALALRGGTPFVISVGMGVCFLSLLILGFSRSLGISGILPPFLAAWLANLILFFSGMYLMIHTET